MMKPKFLDMRNNEWGFTKGSHAGILTENGWALWFAADCTIDLVDGEEYGDSVITIVNDDEVIYMLVLDENRCYEESE